MSNTFYPLTLPQRTASLVDIFTKKRAPFLEQFYLSGGTALSLQLGHRESEDLDFFSETDFKPLSLQIELEKIGTLHNLETQTNTLNCVMDEVKLQFLGYPYPLLLPTVNYEGLELSSVLDIACTKLQTVGMRGSKKDFVDLYVIFEHFALPELLGKMKQKYPNTDFSITHILKSIIYFDDAELQPMPRLHKQIEWEQVKERMKEVVKEIKLA